jgi:uncharacterized membrane protein YhhN
MLYVIYLSVLLIHLTSLFGGITELEVVSKLLLMPLLMVIVVQQPPQKRMPRLITALGFSFIGDALLLFDSPDFFLLGLGSFLIAHLFYVSLFFDKRSFNAKNRKKLVVTGSFVLLYDVLFLLLVQDNLRSFALPVILYVLVISTMLFMAINRPKEINGYAFVLLGAALFVLSDSLIGLNKFYSSIPYARVLIMATYGAGQYLIVRGLTR